MSSEMFGLEIEPIKSVIEWKNTWGRVKIEGIHPPISYDIFMTY